MSYIKNIQEAVLKYNQTAIEKANVVMLNPSNHKECFGAIIETPMIDNCFCFSMPQVEQGTFYVTRDERLVQENKINNDRTIIK